MTHAIAVVGQWNTLVSGPVQQRRLFIRSDLNVLLRGKKPLLLKGTLEKKRRGKNAARVIVDIKRNIKFLLSYGLHWVLEFYNKVLGFYWTLTSRAIAGSCRLHTNVPAEITRDFTRSWKFCRPVPYLVSFRGRFRNRFSEKRLCNVRRNERKLPSAWNFARQTQYQPNPVMGVSS